MTRVAIYTRISTPGQKDGTSPEEQRRILTEIAERQGWAYDVYEEVATAGDGMDGLPILTNIIGRITMGAYSKLLAYHLDRLSRAGVGDGEQIKAILAPLGCDVVTPGSKYDFRDPNDDLRSDFEWLMAKQEHRRIYHRTYGGIEARARTGDRRLGHTVPLGYRVVFAPDGKSSHVEIVEHEAAAIRRAYELLFSGVGGSQAIATRLNAEGFRGKRGKPILHWAVQYWLSNPRYAGMEFRRAAHTRWETMRRKFATGTDAVMTPSTVWPAIVSLEDWERAGVILRRIRDSRARPAASPLGGILRCAACGGPMHWTDTHDGRSVYRCRARLTTNKACKEIPILADEAHRAVWRWIQKVSRDGMPQVKQPEVTDERPAIEAALGEIKRQEDRLMDALLKGVLTDEQVARRNADLRSERDALNRRLALLPKAHSSAALPRIDPALLDEIAPSADDPLYRRFVRAFLASVTLGPSTMRMVRDAMGRRRERRTYRVTHALTTAGHIYRSTNR